MTRDIVRNEYNDFSKGLITEVNPFNDSRNSFRDGENFEIGTDNSVFRRLGMNFETGFTLNADGGADWKHSIISNAQISSFVWKRVKEVPTAKFICVQINNTVHFFDASVSAPSTNRVGSITIESGTSDLISFTEIDGYLVLSDGSPWINIVEYDGAAFSVTTKYIEARDIWGTKVYNWTDKDFIDWTDRPTTTSEFEQDDNVVITGNNRYNLMNQGWGSVRTTTSNNEDSIDYFFTQRGVYPSNADIWWTFKNASNQLDASAGGPVDQSVLANARAPQGRFIINMLGREVTSSGSARRFPTGVGTAPQKKDRTTISGLIGATGGSVITPDSSGIITAIASFANRVWYGFRDDGSTETHDYSPNISSTIAFSKVVSSKEDVNRCYSINDPTSEINAQPLTSDGGTFEVPGMDECVALVPVQEYLIIFGTNGIWAITGGSEGFSATSYILFKISNVGTTSRDSIVEAGGALYYWANSGVFALTIDNQSQRPIATNISITTIQAVVDSISSTARRYVRGTYDDVSRSVRWLVNTDTSFDGVTLRYSYNTELILDLKKGHFKKHTIGSLASRSPLLSGIVSLPDFLFTNAAVVVTDSTGSAVTDSALDDVTVQGNFPTSAANSTKYLVLYPPVSTAGDAPYSITFANYINEDFLDWQSADGTGVDAPAYMELDYNTADVQTGSNSFDAGFSRHSRGAWLVMHLRRTETGFTDLGGGVVEAINQSSCLVRPRWDFANSAAADGKWGSQIQMYKYRRVYTPTGAADTFDYGQSVLTTKDKLRGRGRSLQLRIDTEAGKNCHIYAWTVTQARDRRE